MRLAEAILRASALPVAIAALVAVLGLELARPFQTASIAFDSQSAVVYWDRIATGSHLETFNPTTPKPLIDLLFGLLYGVSHDWRVLAWVTIGVNAVAVALMATLVRRLAGTLAGAFVGVALANNPTLMSDMGFALATPYALLGLVVAGFAVSGQRRRYATAGIALAVAALARVEVLVLASAVALVLTAWWAWARRSAGRGPDRRWWLVPLLAGTAIPAMMIHDTLLTGDPMYWAGVAATFSAQHPALVVAPSREAVEIIQRYSAIGGVTVLAILGFVVLAWQRRWWLVVALLGLGPGIASFLVFLAFRHTVVAARYAVLADVAVIVAAGIGLSWLVGTALDHPTLSHVRSRAGHWLRGTGRPAVAGVAALAALAGGTLAVAVTQPYPWADPEVRRLVHANIAASLASDRAAPVARAALAAGCTRAVTPQVLVPGALWPRLAVDLSRTLTEVSVTSTKSLAVVAGYPAACQIVVHVRGAEPAAPAWSELEVTSATRVGSVIVDPLLADPAAGLWVVAIR